MIGCSRYKKSWNLRGVMIVKRTLLLISLAITGVFVLGSLGLSTEESISNDITCGNQIDLYAGGSGGDKAPVEGPGDTSPWASANLYPDDICVPLIYNGDPETKLDVVFIASHFYTEVGPGSIFANDVDKFLEVYHWYPQYADNMEKMNFYRLDYTDPADDCTATGGNPVCYDRDKLRAMASQCTGYDPDNNDQIVVMFNHRNTTLFYARAEAGIAYMPSDSPGWLMHEFGHSFADLGDEYDSQNWCSVDPRYVNLASRTPGYTCEEKWGDLIGYRGVGCFWGGPCVGWYTPTPYDCLMSHPGNDHHCAVCERHVDSLLSIYEVSTQDTTPPTITVSVSPDVLWPPNHKMVEITATVSVYDEDDPPPTFVLTSIHDTEQADDNGPDVRGADFGSPDLEFQLRAERSGKSDGRTYTIVYTARDASGNSTVDSSHVWVPHDQGQSRSGRTSNESERASTKNLMGSILYPSVPNPFNPTTTIAYSISEAGLVRLRVYNVRGEMVRTLVVANMPPGEYSMTWDGRDSRGALLSTGIYFVRLEHEVSVETRKVILLK